MIHDPIALVLQLRENRHARASILKEFLRSSERRLQLVHLATTPAPYPLQEHASWLLIHGIEKQAVKFEEAQPIIIDAFLASSNQTVLRNLCNALYKLPLIEYRESDLLDGLIAHLRNEDNKIALHVYALYKLIQFVQKYPDIKQEIDQLIVIKSDRDLPPSFQVAIRNYQTAMKKMK